MCKYCEMKLDAFSSLGCHGETIVSGCGAECEITKVAENYYLKLWADTEGLSKEPIKFCPFCGRSLTE